MNAVFCKFLLENKMFIEFINNLDESQPAKRGKPVFLRLRGQASIMGACTILYTPPFPKL
jgi:hypothetical protein